uniref:Transmembrane protein 202 n=1 Tax=Loxodonta africana TaxID=9785 RepID=G3T9U3_LOXAF
MTTNLDLKVSMLSFTSVLATCVLLCLILFLAQVHWHSRDVLESNLLWTYHLNWWGDFLYMFAGIISFLNYITSRYSSPDRNVTVIPIEKSRLGIGPVTTAKDEGQGPEEESQNEDDRPNAGL